MWLWCHSQSFDKYIKIILTPNVSCFIKWKHEHSKRGSIFVIFLYLIMNGETNSTKSESTAHDIMMRFLNFALNFICNRNINVLWFVSYKKNIFFAVFLITFMWKTVKKKERQKINRRNFLDGSCKNCSFKSRRFYFFSLAITMNSL